MDVTLPEASPPNRRLAAIAYVAYLLIGWNALLVPSLQRSIKADFVQTDGAIGLLYFVSAVFYGVGAFGGGLVTERFGRRVVLSVAAALIGTGLVLQALAPTWVLFIAGATPVGLASGVVDGGMNGLILDLNPTRRGGALNLLHLFFSLGAAGSPFVCGQLVEAGVAWQPILLGTGIAGLVIALSLGAHAMPSGRHQASEGEAATFELGRSIVPLVMLGLAIGFYVSSEIGVSSWLVRFLESAATNVATGALTGFWAALALGRLLASRVADRFRPVRFATSCAIAASFALVAAIVVPSLPLSIALFALCGFCFGPVFPMIMAIGGALYPGRIAAVTGGLAGSAVIGGIIYPPLMGVISDRVGIGPAMVGAAFLAFACAAALASASLAARRLLRAVPPGAHPSGFDAHSGS